MDDAAIARFWAKVTKQDGCWLWSGAPDAYGYSRFTLTHSKTVKAHRVAYELVVGPIPDGLVIDHLCKNRACVNPAHMEPVKSGVNVMRGDSLQAKNAAKQHCPKGHPYDEENTYVQKKGSRCCRECGRARNREYHRTGRRKPRLPLHAGATSPAPVGPDN